MAVIDKKITSFLLKRVKLWAAPMLTLVLTLFAGCESGGNGISSIGGPFDYPRSETYISRIASDSDLLYVMEETEDLNGSKINVFDLEGNLIHGILTDIDTYFVRCICAAEGKAYIAAEDGGAIVLYAADTGSGEVKELYEIENAASVDKIGIRGGKLYWLGKVKDKTIYVEPIFEENGDIISYVGKERQLGCLDLESGENTMSPFELPISFSFSGEDVMVYAFDREKGPYFADYSAPEEKIFTRKLGGADDFTFYGKEGGLVFESVGEDSKKLKATKADSETGVAQVFAGDRFYFGTVCASDSGYVWYAVQDEDYFARYVTRYDLGGFSVKGNPIKIISSEYFADYPFAPGYEVATEQLSVDGFALKVLSLDKNYDIALVSSDQSASNDIKEKGGFYPLNDVEGVEEYLDKCFPYIKEAVTDGEGNICMLPISLEIPLIVYDEKNCADNGIAFSSDIGEFIDSVEQASALEGYVYKILPYNMWRFELMSYVSCHDSFDTEEFRELAQLLKERCTEDIFRFTADDMPALYEEGSSVYGKLLFTQVLYKRQQEGLIDRSGYRAAVIPSASSGKNLAVCTFLCVNPYSDRLSETLGYVGQIAKTLSETRNTFTMSDRSSCDESVFADDMFGIYENGEIVFQIPGEIYFKDFFRYKDGEISLDEMIAEGDRKLGAYLNE